MADMTTMSRQGSERRDYDTGEYAQYYKRLLNIKQHWEHTTRERDAETYRTYFFCNFAFGRYSIVRAPHRRSFPRSTPGDEIDVVALSTSRSDARACFAHVRFFFLIAAISQAKDIPQRAAGACLLSKRQARPE